MWLRWNQSTNIFEKSTDDGTIWTAISLDAVILTQGILATARIPPISAGMLAGGIPASKLIVTDLLLTEDQIISLVADLAALSAVDATKAPINSPIFTGNPTAPTPAPGDNDTSIATTAFVKSVTPTYIAPRVFSIASANPAPNVDTMDMYEMTALAAAPTIANPIGTLVNGQKFLFRMKDNGTAWALTWGSAYVAAGVALPLTTVVGKWLTTGFIYNSNIAKWQCVASVQEQ